MRFFLLFFSFLIGCAASVGALDFPDKGGLLDFSQPASIAGETFVLTNPKSGSHLLIYSIMKVAKIPFRGRLPLELFYNDPPCYSPENIMDYELDFSKKTIYWGHEYHTLKSLNINRNKLIFILRNYKENIISNIMLSYNLRFIEEDKEKIEHRLRNEIFNNGSILQEYLARLETYEHWEDECRCLVHFEDLLIHPECFLPQVLSFIGDSSDYEGIVADYSMFKEELREKYDEKGNSTHSASNVRHFSNYITPQTLRQIDRFMEQCYPVLWDKYLYQFSDYTERDSTFGFLALRKPQD